MEIIAESINLLASAIKSVAAWGGFVLVTGIGATTFLIYTDKITLEEIKSLFKKGSRRF